jgi:CcmD family protein
MQNLPDMTKDNWMFITAAYTAAWIAIGGYWLFLNTRLKRSRARFERVARPHEGKHHE